MRACEARFVLALRSIDEGIWDWDPGTDAVSYADRCLEILGLGPDEVAHSVDAWRDRLHPEDADWVRATFRQCATGLRPAFSIEYRLRHKDGSYRWIRARAAALRDASGHIVRLAGGNTDITAGKEAEQALRESEQRFRLLVENSPDAFFLHDMDGAILDVNQRACAMLGYTAAQLRTMHIPDVEVVCPPEALRAIWRDMRPGPFCFDGLGRRKDGTTFPTEVQGVAFVERGRLLGLVATRDVTPRKELERKLELARDQAMAASRAKTEFLASMSHEIRTPLNILLGMTDLLRETPLAARQRQYVDAIENSGNMLLRLINDILDLSRIEAERTDLCLEAVGLRRLLLDLGEAMRIPVENKGLSLTLRLADDLPGSIRTDPARLQQVLLNLIWNAIKFTSRGGIEIAAGRARGEPDGEGLRIAVSDTGIGIPPEALERIFDPFTQVDASTRRRHGGTGLGLAICKRLVELLGGHIRVESAVGGGSCFSFTLPLGPEAAASAAPRSPERTLPLRPSADGQPYCLLLVEDSASNRELVQFFLEDEPCRLISAASGEEALVLFADQAFDLVLMDMEMPGLDGCETTMAMRRLEQVAAVPATPIVMLTAHAFAEYEHKCRQAGCDGFLSKPIRRDRLLAELQRYLKAGPSAGCGPDSRSA